MICFTWSKRQDNSVWILQHIFLHLNYTCLIITKQSYCVVWKGLHEIETWNLYTYLRLCKEFHIHLYHLTKVLECASPAIEAHSRLYNRWLHIRSRRPKFYFRNVLLLPIIYLKLNKKYLHVYDIFFIEGCKKSKKEPKISDYCILILGHPKFWLQWRVTISCHF